MTSPPAVDTRRNPLYTALGFLFCGLGLAGHVLAAQAIGGSSTAYLHHIAGFFLILGVTSGIIVLAGWHFWKRRAALAFFVIGVVQAVFGLWIYLERFHVR